MNAQNPVAAAGAQLRRDAQRNRHRVMDAAREVFGERGLSVSMADVAERARVGVGTVYRRFGSKDELIAALFDTQIDDVAELADQALRADDPWAGLSRFFLGVNQTLAASRGLRELVLGQAGIPVRQESVFTRLHPRISKLVARAQQSGQLSEDLDPNDFPLLLTAVQAVADLTSETNPQAWRRVAELLLRSMATPRTDTPLTTPALTQTETRATVRTRTREVSRR
ncbi:MAG: TetR/AcrR family transcriptional regulator [Mycobacterium sp.]|uniref:TetR/AcrR family transcriptional regulator n=1 Tax=Mycobacterium sp. TaxID=1785 RepID=UPI003F96FE5C